jgi:1,4-alpha-glucan branching enzyme
MVIRTDRGDLEFRYYDPAADQVFLVGDFNGWDCGATQMARNEGGDWMVMLSLPDGVYEYKFLADGHYVLDDAAAGVEEVPFGSNSILVLNQSPVPALPVG